MRKAHITAKEDDKNPILRGLLWRSPAVIVALGLLSLMAVYSYNVFHTLIGIVSAIFAIAIYIIGWNTRKIVNNNYILFIGISFLFIGIMDISHIFIYSIVGTSPDSSDNATMQLFVTTRYLQSIAFLVAPVFLFRKFRAYLAFLAYSVATVMIYLSIFYWRVFPDCFIAGSGYTLFYRISTYIIIVLFAGSMLFLLLRRRAFDRDIIYILSGSICMAIAAEFAFVFISNDTEVSNVAGHILRLLSYYLIYYALAKAALVKPYDVLFRDLKLSEERYRLLASNAQDLIYKIRIYPELKFEFISPSATEILGYSPAEYYSDPQLVYRIVHPTYRQLDPTLKPPIIVKNPVQIRCLHKTGRTVWMEQINTFDYDNHGRLIVIEGIARDITERKEFEEELALKAELLENASNSIFVHDLEGNFIYANSMACKLYGYIYDEIMRLNLYDLIPPANRKLAMDKTKLAGEKGELNFETVGIKKDGSEIHLETHLKLFESGGKQYIISASVDVTERHKVRESLIVTDRLSSLGEMAMGVSHELNNPLTSVVGYTQLLLENPDIKGRAKDDLQKVYSQSKRAAEIIKNFITFARGQPTNKVLVNINDVINNVLKLRYYELGSKGISVETHFAPDIQVILADQGQLQHCFWNIIINAEYFMFEANQGGKLVITTEKTDGWVRITFSDNGPGIDKDVLPHVFDPFYTTRGIGRGTGLGLSICYGVITRHGGTIYAESEKGSGATFIVELPETTDV